MNNVFDLMTDAERRNLAHAHEVSNRPEGSEKPFGGRLEEWCGFPNQSFSGRIYDDPNDRWIEGHRLETSTIVRKYKEDGKEYIETRNTIYELGKELGDE